MSRTCPNVVAKADKSFNAQGAEQQGMRCDFVDSRYPNIKCGGRGHLRRHHQTASQYPPGVAAKGGKVPGKSSGKAGGKGRGKGRGKRPREAARVGAEGEIEKMVGTKTKKLSRRNMLVVL